MSDEPSLWECYEPEDDGDECGLGDDGQCALAGTEHCDFCCPYRDSDLFAGSAAWNRKRAALADAPGEET